MAQAKAPRWPVGPPVGRLVIGSAGPAYGIGYSVTLPEDGSIVKMLLLRI